ncbi:hypothetical protein OSB04_027627 [Centaurea solstitialis]|uniref:Uncharacterized protein n=1 Tax=Centaurea solstitialis TaxID=347529 RepID=A0AA38SR69_9ASTR|nr:hypothetical protein OSB04_027627 [Centaurea solstitialis]
MVLAEIVLGAFINVLFEKLASADLIKLARSEGIHSQLVKWKTTLLQIQALLVDAGNKHITDGAVALWLHELQDLAYDIDDLLDDLATEAMRRNFNQESDHATGSSSSTNKVFKFIPACCTKFTPSNIKYCHKMSCKLDEITTKLQHLAEQKNTLGLNVSMDVVERSNGTYKRLEETSLVDESKVMGREGDKEALLEKLLGDEACKRNVGIVSIVGLGGIGKTTLAKVLYNEKKVKDHFELRAWVCVSEEFNVFNLSKAIFQAVAGMNQEFGNLDLLHVALKEKLLNKRFLVVLDDVWNEDYREWELLQSPFVVGAPGSKVIVTTRKTKVASVMNSFQPYNLNVLSHEKALSLFAQYALDEPNFYNHPTLRLTGQSIVKKCGRLPLALVTLGRMLRTKATDDEWKEVLNSEIWDLQDESQILPALRLSYYDLPRHLKQLFAYCSLLPKGYVFDKIELVLLWMAEGFLNQSYGKKSKESLGREYFEELKSRSFFQTLAHDQSRYIMHDLINDLATSVAGEFFFRLDETMDAYDMNESFEKFRHVSFIGQGYEAYRKLKGNLKRARGLRTFLPVSHNFWIRFYLTNNVLAELLPQLQFLRVLNLSNHTITKVPPSIGSLKHIRYLNFSRTSIECLPEQVSDLYNLQSLLLVSCKVLSSLCVSFAKLINLRHLNINDTPMLTKMPLGIGGLTSLQTLSKVIIEGGNGFKISDLKGISDLQGRLSVMGLDKVTSAIQANDALQQKKGLDDLVLEWSDDFDDSRNHMIEYEVLEELRPHHKLKRLEILFYGGIKFPSWVNNPLFDRLTELRLRGCVRCTCLTALGHLESLKKLYVEGMDGVKILGYEVLGPIDSFHGIAFPLLEVLEFSNMQGWEKWSTRLGGDIDGASRSFPRLRKVSIMKCPKLVQISIDLMPSLNNLCISFCSKEVLESMVSVSSSIVTLEMVRVEGLAQLNGEVVELLGAVEDLTIRGCDELRYLCESKSEECKFLVSLRKLEIRSCMRLVSLGEKGVNLGTSTEHVRQMELPDTLEHLHIELCNSLTSFTLSLMHELPSSLKTLKVLSCHNIESISDNGFGIIPPLCLEYLHITGCKNLKLLPFRYEHLERLTSLEHLLISHCPSMDYSFPCGLWPPNLRTLRIGCLNKPMSEWGMQNYPTSLVHLALFGQDSGVVSFVANAEDVTSSSFLLPPSLISLEIFNFMDVESVSEVIQHLPCLKELRIWSCPKLRDVQENTTNPSLNIMVGAASSGNQRSFSVIQGEDSSKKEDLLELLKAHSKCENSAEVIAFQNSWLAKFKFPKVLIKDQGEGDTCHSEDEGGSDDSEDGLPSLERNLNHITLDESDTESE